MVELVIPILFEDMESAVITWIKKEGDIVDSGEPLYCLETQKANFDIEADQGGTLVEIKVKDQAEVKVLDVVGYIKPE